MTAPAKRRPRSVGPGAILLYWASAAGRAPLARWAERHGIELQTVWARVNRGMPVELALTKPLRVTKAARAA